MADRKKGGAEFLIVPFLAFKAQSIPIGKGHDGRVWTTSLAAPAVAAAQ